MYFEYKIFILHESPLLTQTLLFNYSFTYMLRKVTDDQNKKENQNRNYCADHSY